MNNIWYSLYFSFIFFIGFMYYGKTGDEFAGFGIIGGGIMMCFFLEDFVKVLNIIKELF